VPKVFQGINHRLAALLLDLDRQSIMDPIPLLSRSDNASAFVATALKHLRITRPGPFREPGPIDPVAVRGLIDFFRGGNSFFDPFRRSALKFSASWLLARPRSISGRFDTGSP